MKITLDRRREITNEIIKKEKTSVPGDICNIPLSSMREVLDILDNVEVEIIRCFDHITNRDRPYENHYCILLYEIKTDFINDFTTKFPEKEWLFCSYICRVCAAIYLHELDRLEKLAKLHNKIILN